MAQPLQSTAAVPEDQSTMAQLNASTTAGPSIDRDKALKILAKSIFKELKSQGYETRQIVSLATELIAQVTSDLGDSKADTAR